MQLSGLLQELNLIEVQRSNQLSCIFQLLNNNHKYIHKLDFVAQVGYRALHRNLCRSQLQFLPEGLACFNYIEVNMFLQTRTAVVKLAKLGKEVNHSKEYLKVRS